VIPGAATGPGRAWQHWPVSGPVRRHRAFRLRRPQRAVSAAVYPLIPDLDITLQAWHFYLTGKSDNTYTV